MQFSHSNFRLTPSPPQWGHEQFRFCSCIRFPQFSLRDGLGDRRNDELECDDPTSCDCRILNRIWYHGVDYMRDIGRVFPDMFYSKLESDPDGAHGVFGHTDDIQDFVDCHMNRSHHTAIGKAKLLKWKNSSKTFATQCIKPYSSGWCG